MPNVTKRRGIFYFQKWVPEELREVWPQTYIRVSLGTTDLREANRKAAPLVAEWDEKFQAARDGTLRLHPEEFLEGHAIAWFRQFRDSVDFQRYLEAAQAIQGSPVADPLPGEPTAPLATSEQLLASVQEYLDRNDVELRGPDLDYLLERARQEHWAGFWKPPVLEPSGPKPIPRGKGPGFLETFEAYLRERQPRAKTAEEFRKSGSDFLSLHGGDIPVRAITKAHIVEYKTLLLAKPNAKRLTEKQRKLALRELIEAVQGQGMETISTTTVNKAMVPIHAVLEYAVEHDLIDANPAVGVKAKRSKSTERGRFPYSVDDLNAIFGSRIWSEPRARWTAHQWIPLLCLLTGARLNEIAQLHVSDVLEQEGIRYLNMLTIEAGQKVKTMGSNRRVPIHPDMIRLGFLDYVERRRKAKAQMLFDLTPDRFGNYGANFSKWFTRQRKLFGITHPKKTLHSMRHAWADAARDCDLDSKLADAIKGHADNSVAGKYGSQYSLKVLSNAMNRIKFPGLRLPK